MTEVSPENSLRCGSRTNKTTIARNQLLQHGYLEPLRVPCWTFNRDSVAEDRQRYRYVWVQPADDSSFVAGSLGRIWYDRPQHTVRPRFSWVRHPWHRTRLAAIVCHWPEAVCRRRPCAVCANKLHNRSSSGQYHFPGRVFSSYWQFLVRHFLVLQIQRPDYFV